MQYNTFSIRKDVRYVKDVISRVVYGKIKGDFSDVSHLVLEAIFARVPLPPVILQENSDGTYTVKANAHVISTIKAFKEGVCIGDYKWGDLISLYRNRIDDLNIEFLVNEFNSPSECLSLLIEVNHWR